MLKLVVCEKPSVAQSISKVLGATKRGDGFLEAAAILSAGASAIWWNWRSRKAMKNAMPNGERKTFQFCPIPGNTR